MDRWEWQASNRGQEVQQGQHSSIMAPALEKGVQKSEKGEVEGEIGKMLPFPPLLDKKHPRATITIPQGAGSPAFSNLKEVGGS